MAKRKFPKGRLVGTIMSVTVLVLLFGGLYVPETNVAVFSSDIKNAESLCNGNLECLNEINVLLASVVDTNVDLTESNQSVLNNFIEESGISISEKFGIQTNVALFDSEQNQFNNSTILGIPQLSVTDEQGRLLDLGMVQVSLLSISKNVESNTNVWGKIKFYLDDELVGDKYFWGSAQNTNTIKLSIVDELLFDDSDQNTDKKKALPPPFSQQEKKNFTFTFADEGLDWLNGEEHTYRVVIEEVHAVLNSSKDFKEFDFVGQQIPYELKMKVDGSKKVVIGTDSKATEILKSDNELHMCTQQIYVCAFCGYNQIRKEQTFTSNVPTVNVFDSNKNPIILQAVNNANGCNTFTGIPRNSDLIFSVGGVDYQVKTPISQKNYILVGKLEPTGSQSFIENLAGVTFRGGYTTYSDFDYSNFGYGKEWVG